MKSLINITVLFLGILSLFLDHLYQDQLLIFFIINIIDYLIVILSLYELLKNIKLAKYKLIYIQRNIISLLFLAVYLSFFILHKTAVLYDGINNYAGYNGIIVFRNIFISLKIFSRFQRLNVFLHNIIIHPSQTIVISFLMVIIAGTLLLSMPFSSSGSESIPLIDSLFTSTSAVCVTGLIVVDTASAFSLWGKIIILVLIQIGGLGIMILSFSALFMFRKGVSIENKLLISYMIDDDEISNVSSAVKKITGITLLIEFIGACFLFMFFSKNSIPFSEKIFFSLFHSVSAFCNAGFALFSDSLLSFQNSPGIILTISLLIISGGLSFTVIFDLFEKIKHMSSKNKKKNFYKIRVNTKIVVQTTIILLLSGTLIIYYIEHSRSMKELTIGFQYLNAFFQSVTLRTAGFNSIDFTELSVSMLLIMIVFMFIGGATGSTAGGIKINNLAVILSYIKSIASNRKEIILYDCQISIESVIKALTVVIIGMFVVSAGVIILSFTESFSITDIFFESVSAFATVGLSTGITSALSSAGKTVIIILMFFGRLGTLTLVASLSRSRSKVINISYPEADISLG